ncbi:hypothetical protein ES708_11817 [subsurface metagenome]
MGNDYLMGMITRGGDMGIRIASIQGGVITIPTADRYADVTIEAVNTDKAMLRMLGWNCVATTLTYIIPWVMLMSPTIVRAETANNNSDRDIGWNLIEFESGVKSKQTGTIYFGSGDLVKDETIEEVAPAKSALDCLGWRGGGDTGYTFSCIELINATTIRATRRKSGTTGEVRYQLIEFD